MSGWTECVNDKPLSMSVLVANKHPFAVWNTLMLTCAHVCRPMEVVHSSALSRSGKEEMAESMFITAVRQKRIDDRISGALMPCI